METTNMLTDKITMSRLQIERLLMLAEKIALGHADFRRLDGRDDGTDRAALDIADAADFLAVQYTRLAAMQAEIGVGVGHRNPTGEAAHYRGLKTDWENHAEDRYQRRA
jgi:hypothetical protein